MNKKLPKLVGGLLVALLVIGLVGATIAYAQEGTPTAPSGWQGDGRGPRHGGRGFGQAELEVAAKALGMTTNELTAALKEGKTLEQLATDKSVDLQTVQNAIKAAHEAEMRTRIEQAVTDGTMTREKADWLLEGLDKGFLDGPGFGFGFGLHGPRPDQAPPVQPTQSGAQ